MSELCDGEVCSQGRLLPLLQNKQQLKDNRRSFNPAKISHQFRPSSLFTLKAAHESSTYLSFDADAAVGRLDHADIVSAVTCDQRGAF